MSECGYNTYGVFIKAVQNNDIETVKQLLPLVNPKAIYFIGNSLKAT